MKTIFQKQPRERTIVYLIVGLFVLNAFGLIPVWVIGAYTAEPMKITVTDIQEDGTVQEKTIDERYYHEGLSEGLQNYIYQFFRYSLPVTMSGYFIVSFPEFLHNYTGAVLWGLSLISIPLVLKFTAKFPMWRRILYVYFVAVQISGMWAISHVSFECISFIDYPISPGPPCNV